MLTETLNITSAGSKECRVHLTVHYIGAEVELNFIPMYAASVDLSVLTNSGLRFSELALLFPYHDLDIVFFGPCVFHIGREGLKSGHRSSLISRTV
jgi:hypothetical protein